MIRFARHRGRFSAAPWILLVFMCALSAGCSTAAGEGTVSGAQLYRGCESCHGTEGQGDPALGAPQIAGMPAWSIAAQLARFQDGTRGKHPDDAEGLRMRAMSRQMMSAAEITRIAEYVSQVPRTRTPATLTNVDLVAGQAGYTLCATCHGPQGEGIEPLNSPPLAGLEDWYIALQLKKFQTHVRGMAPGDAVGMQMMGMAMTVQPDQINNVAAYAHQLGQ